MSANDPVAAIDAPVTVRAQRIAELPEGQWFERKGMGVTPQKLAIALSAMANAEGGTVIVGMEDDGTVKGFAGAFTKANALRNAALDLTIPTVAVEYREIDVRDADGKDTYLMAFFVTPGASVHTLTNGDCHLRVGDRSRKLNFSQQRDLMYDRGQANFEAETVPETSIADLDPRLVETYRKAARTALQPERLLANQGLLDGHFKATAAGMLLFGRNPQRIYPNAHVRVLQYSSVERGQGASLTLQAGRDVRCEGPIPLQISESTRVIDDWIPYARRALGRSGTFETQPIIPRDAWIEAVTNAVVHRAYHLTGDHIRVEIFPDRLEVSNPGRFAGVADPSRPLDILRYARNPRIARVCSDLSIGLDIGEGIRRIFREMRRAGLADPAYEETANGVRLVLWARPAVQAGSSVASVGIDRVVAIFREARRPMSTADVADALGVARPTAIRYLKKARERGLVRWDGLSRNDPRASWYLVEDELE
jgi:ATP-dependent DNA helicase RecG